MSATTEQLQLALRLALRAQHTSEFDAAALVRAWPPVAEAALTVHRSLAGPPDVDRTVERIAWDARALAAAMEHPHWPGHGGHDASLLQVTAALKRCAESPAQGPQTTDDLHSAGHLTTSILWSTSQLVGRAVQDHIFDLRRSDAPSAARDLSIAKEIYQRFNAVQQLASGVLGAPPDRTPDPSGPIARLRRAIAVWDVEAHRALLGDRSTAVLHVLSHLEAESVQALEYFVSHAAGSGVIDQVTAGRLIPVLRDSTASWTRLRDAAAELSFSSVAVPMPLIQAGRGLQKQLMDAATTADLNDHPQILVALTGHLASGLTISAAARELINNGELRAPARAMSRVLVEQYPDRIGAPIDAVAIHRRLTLPLNLDARRLLDMPARRALLDAHEAVNRSAGLDTLYRSAAAAQTIQPRQPGIQAPRTAMTIGAPGGRSGPTR